MLAARGHKVKEMNHSFRVFQNSKGNQAMELKLENQCLLNCTPPVSLVENLDGRS